jgi:hypothetical protein
MLYVLKVSLRVKMRSNLSIERTSPGKPSAASHVNRLGRR